MKQRGQLVFDIETYPNLDMLDFLPEVEPSKVLKDPEKILNDIEAKQKKQIEEMALNPLYGKIACISLYNKDIKEVLIGEEKEILKQFFEKTIEYQLISYNGINFDIPFIFKRACVYGMATIKQMENYIKKFDDFNHIDLMQKFCEYGKYEKLNNLTAVFLNGEKKIDFDVKLIPELIETKEGKKQLIEYRLKDAELTYKLAEKFGYIENEEDNQK